MTKYGIIDGFQWLDGSFLENIEVSALRPPSDLDLVTFCGGLSTTTVDTIKIEFPEFLNPALSKATYKLDHYPVDFMHNPFVTVEVTRYWVQLFTHNKRGVWKGILELPINSAKEDNDALVYLNSLML